MSKQKFQAARRQAIWIAHDRRCFYCKKPLSWDSLRIDHLVPEYLMNDADKRLETLRDLALPDTWDLRANANLVAACDPCNARKRDRLSLPKQMILFVTEAREKAERVDKLYERLAADERRDLLLAQLETAFALGRLTREDLDRLRQQAEGGPDAPVRLVASLQFIEDLAFTELRPSEVERFLDSPVRLGADLPEGLELVRDLAWQDVRRVKTSREYRDAVAAGYYAPRV